MSELKPPPIHFGGQAGAGIPGLSLLTLAAARCWVILAVLALTAGLIWRGSGFAPPLLTLLDGIGVALWCTALFLEPAWARLQAMQARHFSMSPAIWIRQYAVAALVGLHAVPLALAALATLLAYDTRMVVARILTFEKLNVSVAAGTFCLAILLLAGPALICLSLALLSAGRAWLGRGAGTLFWLAGLLLINSGALWNGNLRTGLSLGRLADILKARMNLVNFDPTQGMYLSDLVIEALVLPLAALGVCIVLLAWTAMRPRPVSLSRRSHAGWLSAVAALGMVCLATWLSTDRWAGSPGIASPGSWTGLLLLGLTTLVIGSALLNWTGAGLTSRLEGTAQLVWGLAAVPLWGLYTLPNLYAGQAVHGEVLSLLAVLLVVSALFLAISAALGRAQAEGHAAAQAGYLLIVALAAIPLDPEYGSGVTFLVRALYQAVQRPEYRLLSLPMAVVVVLLLIFALWQLYKRPARTTARQPTPAE